MRPRLLALSIFLAALAACHDPQREEAAPKLAAQAPVPHAPVTRVITAKDHLTLVELQAGDFLETPADETFDWSFVWEGPTVFDPVPDAPPGRYRFRAARAGGARMILSGAPKCMKIDAACGISKRVWTIFLAVH